MAEAAAGRLALRVEHALGRDPVLEPPDPEAQLPGRGRLPAHRLHGFGVSGPRQDGADVARRADQGAGAIPGQRASDVGTRGRIPMFSVPYPRLMKHRQDSSKIPASMSITRVV